MKPGWKTTELYVTILTDVGLVASAAASVLPAKWAAIGAAVANVAYAVSRGLAKQAAPASSSTTVTLTKPAGS